MKAKSLKFKIGVLVSVLALVTFTLFVNGQGAKDTSDLSKNTELKNDVFKQIINNKNLFNEFMNTMMQNSQSMKWMMDNQGMMQHMFSNKNLGYMMQNQNMSHMMMQNMMNTIQSDPSYNNQWNQMMNQKNGNSNNMHQGMMMHN